MLEVYFARIPVDWRRSSEQGFSKVEHEYNSIADLLRDAESNGKETMPTLDGNGKFQRAVIILRRYIDQGANATTPS